MLKLDPLELTSVINELDRPGKRVDAQVSLIYQELKNIAAQKLKGNSLEYTLSPTQLVNEVYIRLFNEKRTTQWSNRKQFFYVCSKVLSSTIVDYARRKYAAKRPPSSASDNAEAIANQENMETIIAIGNALESIQQADEELATIIELRFFMGFTTEEIAEYTQTSGRTVQRKLLKAKEKLQTLLQ